MPDDPIQPGRAERAAPRAQWPRPRHRTFHAYNVSLAKCGTRSMAGIFANYRSLHEYLLPSTVRKVARWQRGEMSDSEFREFIRWRDAYNSLDIDSSSFNCYYVNVLVEEFPDARFVFVMRDCFSWLDSLLNMVFFGASLRPEYMLEDYMQKLLGPAFGVELAQDENEMQARLPAMVEHAMEYWATHNDFVLRHLPPDRSLVLKLDDLAGSRPALASLVGIPADTLVVGMDRLNPARDKLHLLDTVSPTVVLDAFHRHCRPLMTTHFPEATFEKFLERDHAGVVGAAFGGSGAQ
ncbi:MAG TPA: sulfotransferase [Chloroflexota bacterium]|nr:sulfotransferase [Chloroflexota bacterium]